MFCYIMNSINKKPLILAILDGWGIASPSKGNVISLAKLPVFNSLLKKYPNTQLIAHGEKVGLSSNQDGNSEAGHMNLGAGRIVEQDSLIISRSINNGTFVKNPAFAAALKHIKKNNSHLHLIGMLSNGMSAHSDPDHLLALLSLARQEKVKKVFIHLFTDGRDSPRYASLKLIEALMRVLKKNERIATICGRFWAMDRKKEWTRTEKAYDALTLGKGLKAKSPQEAITQSYNRNETDEFIKPYIIIQRGKPLGVISDKDAVVFFNLRSDRTRQLTKCFVQKGFQKKNPGSFKRKKQFKNLVFVAMTSFGPDLDSILTAFPSPDLKGTLPMALKDFRQFYISETEKYAHITYFFNGGYADPVAGEGRGMVPSPYVDSYDEAPEMGTREITKAVAGYLQKDKYDFICLNYAAPDMVGHTGNLKAGIRAVEVVDESLGKLIKAVEKCQGTLIITSDHGNIEEMLNKETGEVDTEHSTNPVPFIVVNAAKKIKLKKGNLGNVAPTILDLLDIKKPREMKEKSLITN